MNFPLPERPARIIRTGTISTTIATTTNCCPRTTGSTMAPPTPLRDYGIPWHGEVRPPTTTLKTLEETNEQLKYKCLSFFFTLGYFLILFP